MLIEIILSSSLIYFFTQSPFSAHIQLIPKWPLLNFRYSFVLLFKLDLDASFKAKYSFEFSAQERGIKG